MTPLQFGFWKNFLNTTCIDLESIQKEKDPEKLLHAALLDPSEAFSTLFNILFQKKKLFGIFKGSNGIN